MNGIRQPSSVALRLAAGLLFLWAFVGAADAYGLPLALSLPVAVVCLLVLVRVTMGSLSGPLVVGAAPASPAGHQELSPNLAHGVLAAVVAAALVLRLVELTDKPVWADEMWTLRNMYTDDWLELLRVAFDDYWPPLHYLLLNAIARVTDTSIFWLRLPSVLFGAAAVAVMYPLARTLGGSRLAALFAAALLAGSISHLVYSQEARVYSMQVFFAILSALYFFQSYWQRRISPGFLLSTALLTYSHSFASWYFIAGQSVFVVVAYWIWRDRQAFVKGLQSQVLAVVCWLPLVAAFAFSRLAREIVVPTYWATASEAFPTLFDLVRQYQGLAVRTWPGAVLWAGLGVASLVVSYRILKRSDPFERAASGARAAPPTGDAPRGAGVAFALLWVVVPVAFSLVVTVTTSLDTFGDIRYHLAVLPGLCVWVAFGFMAIREPVTRGVVLTMAVLLPLAELPEYYLEFDRAAMDDAAEIIARDGTSDEAIYADGAFRALAYYLRGDFPRIGSEAWKALAEASAPYEDEYVFRDTRKWGDTYAYEKIPIRIRYIGIPQQRQALIRDELDSGRLSDSFWIVTEFPPGASGPPRTFADDLEDAGLECETIAEYRVRWVALRRCEAIRPATPSEARS